MKNCCHCPKLKKRRFGQRTVAFISKERRPEVNETPFRNAETLVFQYSIPTNRFAGFDVMTLANNHLNDFGDLPVNYTINSLKEVGIEAVGVTYGPYNCHQVILNLNSKTKSH